MLITRIKGDAILSKFLSETCCENGICVTFDESVLPDSYVIIRVDQFYNSFNVKERPASVDCLIIRKCQNTGYGLTLVELKKISTTNFELSNIKEKFDTTLFNFIKQRFSDLLDINYKEVKLYYVSQREIYKRDLGLKMEVLINFRFRFDEKNLMIKAFMPNPTLKNCY